MRVAPAAAAPVRSGPEEAAIITTLIVTQGHLADELLAAARKIVGEGCSLSALSLDWEDGVDVARAKLEDTVDSLTANGGGLLILTDIYGGTPHNMALSLRRPGRVEVLSGVNLPMVVRLSCGGDREMTLEETAEWIREKARASICCGDQRRNGDNGGA